MNRKGSLPGVWQRGADRIASRRLAGVLIVGACFATGAALIVRQVFLQPTPEAVSSSAADGVPMPPVTMVAVREAPTAAPRPEDARAFDKGRKLLAAGETTAALKLLTRASLALPNDALVTHVYGMALWRAGSRDRALFHLEKAVLMAPGVASYRLEFARDLIAAGRRDRAVREYEEAHALNPADEAIAQTLAALTGRMDQQAPALAVTGAALGAAPGAGAAVDLGGAPSSPMAASNGLRSAAGTARAEGSGSSPKARVFTEDDLRRYRSAPASEPLPVAVPASTVRDAPNPRPPGPGGAVR